MPPSDRQRCPGTNRPCKNWPWSRTTAYCRNHDPALAEQRKQNGRVRTKPTAPPPPAADGWRPEWQRREDRAQNSVLEHLARMQELLEAPLPESPELREEVLRILRAIANDPAQPGASRVGACSRLLEHTKPTAPSTGPGASSSTPAPSRPWMKPVDGSTQ